MAQSDPTLEYFNVPYHISSEIASAFSSNQKIENERDGLKLMSATVSKKVDYDFHAKNLSCRHMDVNIKNSFHL